MFSVSGYSLIRSSLDDVLPQIKKPIAHEYFSINLRYDNRALLLQPFVEHLTLGYRRSPSIFQTCADFFDDRVERTTFTTCNGR